MITLIAREQLQMEGSNRGWRNWLRMKWPSGEWDVGWAEPPLRPPCIRWKNPRCKRKSQPYCPTTLQNCLVPFIRLWNCGFYLTGNKTTPGYTRVTSQFFWRQIYRLEVQVSSYSSFGTTCCGFYHFTSLCLNIQCIVYWKQWANCNAFPDDIEVTSGQYSFSRRLTFTRELTHIDFTFPNFQRYFQEIYVRLLHVHARAD